MNQWMKRISSLGLAMGLSAPASAGVLGDFQTFTPNTDGLYFISADSAKTLPKGVLNANAYVSYAKNFLMTYDNLTNMKRLKYKDELVELDGTFGYSLQDNLQLFMGLTAMMYQKPDKSEATQHYLTKGVHSFRPGFKWNFSSEKDSNWALMASVDILNVTDDPYTGVEPKPIYNGQLVWSGGLGGRGTHGFNLGFRQRNPGPPVNNAPFYPLKNQWTASYAYSYPWTSRTRLVFETIACAAADKGQNKTYEDVSCLEVLGAVRHRLNKNWAFVGGATVEAPSLETMAPDWRVFAGMNLYLYPQDSKDKKKTNEPLSVPLEAEIARNDVYTIPISGGTMPYHCEVEEGHDLIEVKECDVLSRSQSGGPAIVRVTDAAGSSRLLNVYVLGDTPTVTAEELRLDPPEATLITGETLTLSAIGGTAPYRYSVKQGGGGINPKSGTYRAGLNPARVVIEVQDADGKVASSQISVQAPKKANEVLTLKNVNFVFDTAELVKESVPVLDKAIAVLMKFKIKQIIVEGHTDNKGAADYNRVLSEKRARAIGEVLVDRLGLRESQVKAIGYGMDRPLVSNNDEESRLKNRRVELLIYTEDN